MSDRPAPLHPWPLARLLERVRREYETRGEIFSLPAKRFFRVEPDLDLGLELAGRRLATPVGPAAGPHTQLAQNIALGWLAGARTFELKTVQILDELDIARPCIDMEQVGYNIEWSQELTLEQSRREYAKAWLLLGMLREWEPLRGALGAPGEHAFELSVGYDLVGISAPPMAAFIDGLLAAGPLLDDLRREVPAAWRPLRDVAVRPRLVDTVTLGTFHGCPPDEIEGIVRHLMTAHGLDVTVKLNPTLLGAETVRAVLHDRLGYGDVPLVPEAFVQDLQWERALAMIDRLEAFGREHGREFGLKLTNTLVVENRRGVMPGERMYLSGRPLHVLAATLLDRLAGALPGRLRLGTAAAGIPVAFSAGIDKDNLADAAALGLGPVTVCSDLLRPGGYGRLAQGLRGLGRRLREAGLDGLPALRRQAEEAARAEGRRDAVDAYCARLETAAGAARYTRAGSDKPLRRVQHVLEAFDCVACANCVTVCPNDAFLHVPTPAGAGLAARHQYLVLAELCNECGNCTTFCPEQGAPHRIKPRLYTDAAAWRERGREGFLVTADADFALLVSGEGAAAAQVAACLDGEDWLPGADE